MKYCRYCGQQVDDEAILCVHCGRQLEQPHAPVQNSSSNINLMCMLGFIFSFIFSVVGLILSIIGYNQVKQTNENSSKTLAKAGIIISSISIGLVFFILILYFILIMFALATI